MSLIQDSITLNNLFLSGVFFLVYKDLQRRMEVTQNRMGYHLFAMAVMRNNVVAFTPREKFRSINKRMSTANLRYNKNVLYSCVGCGLQSRPTSTRHRSTQHHHFDKINRCHSYYQGVTSL